MTWAGASSINAPGFVIDLGKFRGIDFDQEKELVTFGAGLRWKDVYDHLATQGRIVRGARVMQVGVGGFLLGGLFELLSGLFSSRNSYNLSKVEYPSLVTNSLVRTFATTRSFWHRG